VCGACCGACCDCAPAPAAATALMVAHLLRQPLPPLSVVTGSSSCRSTAVDAMISSSSIVRVRVVSSVACGGSASAAARTRNVASGQPCPVCHLEVYAPASTTHELRERRPVAMHGRQVCGCVASRVCCSRISHVSAVVSAGGRQVQCVDDRWSIHP
jgi:hypothetical protein